MPPAAYARVRPRAGHTLTIRAWPTGGDDRKTATLILAIVVIIVIAVVTWGAGLILAPAYAGLAGVIGGVAGAAVGIGGTLLINASIPPPKPKLADSARAARRPPRRIP